MPDLRTDHVTAWLAAATPTPLATEWPPPIRAIETETNTPVRLAEFGRQLDALEMGSDGGAARLLGDVGVQDRLRALLAQLGAARLLRLLQWMSDDGPPSYAPLLTGHSSDAAALRASVGALTRGLILQRIFSRERLAALQAACADAAKETA